MKQSNSIHTDLKLAEGVTHLLDLQGVQRALLLGASVKEEALCHPKVKAENRQTSLRVAVAD